MAANERQAWALLGLLSRANEQIAASGGVPGAPLDTQTWIDRHMKMYPREFAYEDWSGYRPVLRKTFLVPLLSSERMETREGRR